MSSKFYQNVPVYKSYKGFSNKPSYNHSIIIYSAFFKMAPLYILSLAYVNNVIIIVLTKQPKKAKIGNIRKHQPLKMYASGIFFYLALTNATNVLLSRVQALGFLYVFYVFGSIRCGSANRTLIDFFGSGRTNKHRFGWSLV